MSQSSYAPGRPGLPPRWSSSAKTGVGCAVDSAGRCAFTIGRGIVNEIYYPRLDQASTRDMGFLLTADDGFFSEEQRDCEHHIHRMDQGAPVYEITATHNQKRYRIHKRILTDPDRDVLLQWTKLEIPREKPDDAPKAPADNGSAPLRLYLLINPHVDNRGGDNTAWLGDYKGAPLLLAANGDITLAVACSIPFLQRSVGFVGVSDGWQDLKRHGRLQWFYDHAEHGNVALTGRIDLSGGSEFLVAVGFGKNAAEAGQRAMYCINDGWRDAFERYTGAWDRFQGSLHKLDASPSNRRPSTGKSVSIAKPRSRNGEHANLYRASTMVLRIHESQNFPGGTIASLSIPWGQAKGDNDIGGYHLVWARDMCEAIGGLIAVGAKDAACRGLAYLRVTQETDGHWPQVMWMDGSASRDGIQMDETALPILLVDLADRKGLLHEDHLPAYAAMLSDAAGYLLRRGPNTPQDRWENSPGFSPFTLAAEVAALLTAADFIQRQGADKATVEYLRQSADLWNACIEPWTYVRGTRLAEQCGVDGYYVRITPPQLGGMLCPPTDDASAFNRALSESNHPAASIVSPDALALVRFGLRKPDDPRILNTVKVIDAVLKTDTPRGPGWHRYQNDNYGETDDGQPFMGRGGGGHGRLWPLLTGERAHYELAAKNMAGAKKLLRAMEAFAGDGDLLPEQVWDAAPIPDRQLFPGRPSGSAMPLVWAHAEYVKLLRSIREGKVFDLPPAPVNRYIRHHSLPRHAVWRFSHPLPILPPGLALRLEMHAAATIRYSLDDWKTPRDLPARDPHCGVYFADLPAARLKSGDIIRFTFHWTQSNRWEGRDFAVRVGKVP